MELVEKKFGTGLERDLEDQRDRAFASVGPFDWELGFDIELLLGYRAKCSSEQEFWGIGGRNAWGVARYREIVKECEERQIEPFKLPVKNQGASSSCTGQGLAYYLEVLNFIETGEYIEISPRDVYAYISLGFGKGAYLRDALKLACDRGVGSEDLVPCYHKIQMSYGEVKNPYSEAEYLVKPEETKELIAIREALQSREYRVITGYQNLMERMAWEMLLGFGSYFGVDGVNNGSWHSEYPQPPKEGQAIQWRHALFGGKAGIDKDGQPFISPINSWGTIGVNGWQKLKQNYFDVFGVFTPWTLIDKNNNWNNMSNLKSNVKILKDKNGPAVGIWQPAISPEALTSLCLNFGIEVPKKADGSIDWSELIDGEFEQNK